MSQFREQNLPKPLTPTDKDLYLVIEDMINNLKSILNGGILFSDNFDANYSSYTSNATPNTTDTIAHGLGKIPTGFLVVRQNKAASLYDSGTAWTATNIYLKCSVASVASTILVF